MFMRKGIVENIVFKQNTHSTDVNKSSHYWFYAHKNPSSPENKKICCFCVWDIPVIMLIMKIIYEIKSYKTYNIVKSIHVSPMNTYASKSLI